MMCGTMSFVLSLDVLPIRVCLAAVNISDTAPTTFYFDSAELPPSSVCKHLAALRNNTRAIYFSRKGTDAARCCSSRALLHSPGLENIALSGAVHSRIPPLVPCWDFTFYGASCLRLQLLLTDSHSASLLVIYAFGAGFESIAACHVTARTPVWILMGSK
ncbi:hypothetical protein C8F04DRAFT_1193134 [Mycena alexandri]|uniref:Secreted protein n=1 Tax=Mycena alexandri TaxID=1745969 RepID=A0AAD6WUF4_9AGAR|nr:hypothetical protein C8F04DRAFT_1193134 [Mycena alexandri]